MVEIKVRIPDGVNIHREFPNLSRVINLVVLQILANNFDFLKYSYDLV